MHINNESLYHHGIKGQKWGVRRFQNKNGGLTAAGRKRYDNDVSSKKKTKKQKRKRTVKSKVNRNERIARIKRSMNLPTKEAIGTTAMGLGIKYTNQYLANHKVTLNDKPIRVGNLPVGIFLGEKGLVGKQIAEQFY